jgi:hypothetical protein
LAERFVEGQLRPSLWVMDFTKWTARGNVIIFQRGSLKPPTIYIHIYIDMINTCITYI